MSFFDANRRRVVILHADWPHVIDPLTSTITRGSSTKTRCPFRCSLSPDPLSLMVSFTCPQCGRTCRNLSGLTQHQNSAHGEHAGLSIPVSELRRNHHPYLNGTYNAFDIPLSYTLPPGRRCDKNGVFVSPNAPPELPTPKAEDDWSPFASRAGFELADFLFTDAELSQRKINYILELWAATLVPHNDSAPITNHLNLHRQIDAIGLGNIQWEHEYLKYKGPLPTTTRHPEWKTAEYDVWYRDPREVIKNILARPDFDGHVDYGAYQEFDNEKRQYGNMMSGDWAWRQSVRFVSLSSSPRIPNPFPQDTIARDPKTHGSMFIPVILGSDKTTVSVATGQNDFYPLYLSIGNVQNHIRRAHKNALVLIGFLPIPKGLPRVNVPSADLISTFSIRCKKGYGHRRVPVFQTRSYPQINRNNPPPPARFHENPRHRPLPRPILSSRNLWTWPPYLRLPRTGDANVDTTKLVSNVCCLYS